MRVTPAALLFIRDYTKTKYDKRMKIANRIRTVLFVSLAFLSVWAVVAACVIFATGLTVGNVVRFGQALTGPALTIAIAALWVQYYMLKLREEELLSAKEKHADEKALALTKKHYDIITKEFAQRATEYDDMVKRVSELSPSHIHKASEWIGSVERIVGTVLWERIKEGPVIADCMLEKGPPTAAVRNELERVFMEDALIRIERSMDGLLVDAGNIGKLKECSESWTKQYIQPLRASARSHATSIKFH